MDYEKKCLEIIEQGVAKGLYTANSKPEPGIYETWGGYINILKFTDKMFFNYQGLYKYLRKTEESCPTCLNKLEFHDTYTYCSKCNVTRSYEEFPATEYILDEEDIIASDITELEAELEKEFVIVENDADGDYDLQEEDDEEEGEDFQEIFRSRKWE